MHRFRCRFHSICVLTRHTTNSCAQAALHVWTFSRSEESLRILKFLVDAGADIDFRTGCRCVDITSHQLPSQLTHLIRTPSTKTLLFYSSLETLLGHSDATVFSRLASTSQVAIDICQSIFRVDILDIAEDALDEVERDSEYDVLATRTSLGLVTTITSHLAPVTSTLSSPTMKPLGRAALLDVLAHESPLEYAVRHKDSAYVLKMLEDGEDASGGSPLAAAISYSRAILIRPLLKAGARVNAIDKHGMTALHWACWAAETESLAALVEGAEADIAWDQRTKEGKTGIEVFEESGAPT